MRQASLLACVLLISLTGAAHAAISYGFFTSQTSYVAAPGQAVAVAVFLRETVTGSDVSPIVSDGGLFGAGVAIVQANSPASPSAVLAEADIAGDPAFDGNLAPSLAPLELSEVINIDPPSAGVEGVSTGAGIREIHVGTFTFHAGNDGVTQFRVERRGPSIDDTITVGGNYALDGQIARSQFSIAVVPEPVTMSLFVGAGMVLAARWRRR